MIRWAQEHADWVLGFQDEVWWSRFKPASLSSWCTDDAPMRLVQQNKAKDDTDPKAFACYGLMLRHDERNGEPSHEMLLRFVDGRTNSDITIQFLDWCCTGLAARGKRALLMIWDNATWHTSKAVQDWIRDHNRQVKRSGHGVRLIDFLLPIKSPWLNPIEPMWAHAKRRIIEPDGTLSAQELADRVCAALGCDHLPHLPITENVT